MNKPTKQPDLDHYRAGWNDLEYGVNNWTPTEKWSGPLEWAKDMAKIALECQPQAVGSHNKAHYQGTIDAAKSYQELGVLRRL